MLRITVEIFFVEQSGQIFTLCGLNDASVFIQFDSLLHSRQHDLRDQRIFGKKISRAHRETVDLGMLVAREDDDRNIHVIIARFQPLDHIIASHLRHIQIQQDQGQQITVFLDFLHRFLAVFRHDNIEIILDDVSQHLPVDDLVIDNEDEPLAGDGVEFHMTF